MIISETLLWLDGDGRAVAQQVGEVVEVDEVIFHEAKGRQLVEVKAARFLSDETITALRKFASIRQVKRLCACDFAQGPQCAILDVRGHVAPRCRTEDAAVETGRCLRASSRQSDGTEILANMVEIVRILRCSIQQGIAGTHYDDRVLGYQCGKLNTLMASGRLLSGVCAPLSLGGHSRTRAFSR